MRGLQRRQIRPVLAGGCNNDLRRLGIEMVEREGQCRRVVVNGDDNRYVRACDDAIVRLAQLLRG